MRKLLFIIFTLCLSSPVIAASPDTLSVLEDAGISGSNLWTKTSAQQNFGTYNGNKGDNVIQFVWNVEHTITDIDSIILYFHNERTGVSTNIALKFAVKDSVTGVQAADSTIWANEIKASTRTTAQVDWDLTAPTLEVKRYRTPDLSAPIKEWMGLPSWGYGESVILSLIVLDDGSATYGRFTTATVNATGTINDPLLLVYYSAKTSGDDNARGKIDGDISEGRKW